MRVRHLPWQIPTVLLLGLAALTYAVHVHLHVAVYPEDDAFITYRYVENLLSGRGLVYNQGERIFGVSSPLYVVWLALIKALFPTVPLPVLAVRGNLTWYASFGVGLILLLARLMGSLRLGSAFAAIFLVRDDMLRASTGGMETFLFASLVVLCLWACTSNRLSLGALFAGMSVVSRPEGAVAGGIVTALWFYRRRQGALSFFGYLLTPALVWVLFSLYYFGTPIPHSLVAKSAPLYPLPWGDSAVRILAELEMRILGDLSAPSLTGYPLSWRFSVRTVFLLGLLLVAAIGYKRQGVRSATKAAFFPVILFGGMLLFYVIANPLMFPWYYPTLVVLGLVSIVVGIFRLCDSVPSFKVPVIAMLLFLTLVITVRLPIARGIAGGSVADVGVSEDPGRRRVDAYRAAAEWLNDHLSEGARVLGAEIGALGFYYHGRVLDACGLVSPEAVKFHPVPLSERYSPDCGAIPFELVRTHLPEAVVSMATFAEPSLYRKRWFAENYRHAAFVPLPCPVWNTPNVDIFLRVGSVAQTPLPVQ